MMTETARLATSRRPKSIDARRKSPVVRSSDSLLFGGESEGAADSSGSRAVLRQFEFAVVFLPVKMAFHTGDLGV